jgi:glycosyltransferase involved in cell wall biosynthesis
MTAALKGRAFRIAVYMHDLAGGGSERVNVDLTRDWLAAGHTVTLVLHSKSGELVDQLPIGLAVETLDTSRAIADTLPLARYLRTARPDVLLTSLDHNNIVGLLAKLLARSRTPVIVCQHNPFIMDRSRMTSWTYYVLPPLYRALHRFAAGIVAVSDGVAEDFSRATGRRRDGIDTIYNPIVGPVFLAKAAETVEHPWLDGQGPLYVAAGRLVTQKNHDLLLRAFALHQQTNSSARLLILGDGPRRAELEALALELGIGGSVRFEGFVKNPLPYIRKASAFVLTSRYEGFGNVIVEAFGVGTPVISVDCLYGPSEILQGGRLGRLVPNDDVEALANAFSPNLREIWPSEMLIHRAGDFTSQASSEKYLDVIHRVVHGPGTTLTAMATASATA